MLLIYILSAVIAALVCSVFLLYREVGRKQRAYGMALEQLREYKERNEELESKEYDFTSKERLIGQQEDTIADLQLELSMLRYKLSRKPNRKKPKK